tara:strand:- start:606 stop:1181 length:576 start_codon:yes stop_codon:yes gene_type:complete
MIHVDPPFDLGETLKGTQKIVNDDNTVTTTTINSHWEGAVFHFPDYDRSPSPRGDRKRRSGRTLKCVCVRNTKGSALTAPAGKLHRFDLGQTGRAVVGSIDDLAGAADWCAVVDPELGSNDVEDDDLVWVVVEGIVSLTDSGSGISAGDVVAPAADGDIASASASSIEIIGHALDAIGANATGLVSVNIRI